MEQQGFILACSECGQRIELKKGISFDELVKKFNIVVNDNKEILIMCNGCGNRVKF